MLAPRLYTEIGIQAMILAGQLALWSSRGSMYDPPRRAGGSQPKAQTELGSMQSKFMVFCRAMVMLIALIGLPALAIWGLDRPIPPIVADWLGRIRVALVDRHWMEADATAATPPSFDRITEVRDLPSQAPMLANNVPQGAPHDFSQPAGPAAHVGNSTAAGNTAAGNTNAGKTEPMLEIERRLRQLGASHYLLERWGGEQNLYRFCCEMPFLGQAGFHHHFEATAASPLRAMSEVLEKVDAWRTSTARRAGQTLR